MQDEEMIELFGGSDAPMPRKRPRLKVCLRLLPWFIPYSRLSLLWQLLFFFS
jgi:hypothetical protein